MAATIGIKIANGDFYSIMEENKATKKRLVLTTVHDNQKSVQIDLYKSYAKSMADAMYIGSLVVENISPKPKGEPSIELVISADAEGVITAESYDTANPSQEKQNLSLHLKAYDGSEDAGDYSNFDIGEESGQSLFEKSAAIHDEYVEEKKSRWWIPVLIILLLLGLAALWYFVLRPRGIPMNLINSLTGKTESVQAAAPAKAAPVKEPEPPAPEPVKAEPVKAPEPVKAEPVKAPEPVKEPVKAEPAKPAVIDKPPPAPAKKAPERKRTAPVYSFKVPQTIPSEGIPYKIRWGDTLWDISEAFYRNAWLYPRIVRFNKIRNPNLIVSGTTITIPPK